MPDKRLAYDKWYTLGCLSILAEIKRSDRSIMEEMIMKAAAGQRKAYAAFYNGRMDMAIYVSRARMLKK